VIYAKDYILMGVAKEVSKFSDDPDTQVGAVIARFEDGVVVSSGSNSFPSWVSNEGPRLLRPKKYLFLEHAERWAIYAAHKNGMDVQGGNMYCTLHPCAECVRAMIGVGIGRLVCPKPNLSDPRWCESFEAAVEMLNEAGITVDYIDDLPT
jgi:dCMP deaminase